MSKYVLDASALLALLNDEPGAQRVEQILPQSVIGAVNVSETAGKLASRGMSPEDVRISIGLLNLEIIPFDRELAFAAGALIVHTKKLGLSLGDRACLALALARNNTAVTAESAWSRLKLGTPIEVIRGRSTS
ncbi:MAG TPA: type II toxin-antitoxin system VapC family toxin [Terriglobia bacterium]